MSGAILQSFLDGEGELFGDEDLDLSLSGREVMERLMFKTWSTSFCMSAY